MTHLVKVQTRCSEQFQGYPIINLFGYVLFPSHIQTHMLYLMSRFLQKWQLKADVDPLSTAVLCFAFYNDLEG